MSDNYALDILRRNVAQICQTVGFESINSTPFDILTDVMKRYIKTFGTLLNRYAEQSGRTEPNLNDLGLVFRDLHMPLSELAEVTRLGIPPVKAEQFPKYKESHLNFLKPDSREVTTRPMHVHEHLPPMYPKKEPNGTSTFVSSVSYARPGTSDSPEDDHIFKKPLAPVSLLKRKKSGPKIRKISTLSMSNLGVIIASREGVLPKAYISDNFFKKEHTKHKDKSHQPDATNKSLPETGDKKSKKDADKSKTKDKTQQDKTRKSKDNTPVPGHALNNNDDQHTHHNPSRRRRL